MLTPHRCHQLNQGAEPRTDEEREYRAERMRKHPPIREPRPADAFPFNWEDRCPMATAG